MIDGPRSSRSAVSMPSPIAPSIASETHTTSDQPDEREQVHAVGDVVPVGVAEAPPLPGLAQLGEGGLRRSLIGYHHGFHECVGRHRRKNVLPSLHTCVVDTETVQLFVGLLTIVAGIGAVSLVVLRVLAAAGNDGAHRLGSAISDAGVWLAFLVALGATVGSLYFSEVANFNPCRFCWFQRIAMYPLTVILLVGGLRKDPERAVVRRAAGRHRRGHLGLAQPDRVATVARQRRVRIPGPVVHVHLVPRVRPEPRQHGA